ncbi:MAG: acyloxyacyl hydrolase [Bacteroidaceae bacterium]|nr:acyloxyacyl hydrolase [Bacteroidaceae bacterium]
MTLSAAAQSPAAASARDHIGFQLSGSLARLIPQNEYTSSLVHSYSCNYQDARFLWHTLPADGNIYDRAYHYPTLQAGILHADFSDIRLNRFAPDYDSKLGHAIALYGGIQIDFLRRGRWSLGCDLQNGVAFFTRHYDFNTNRDDEIIGSVAAIYVGASLQTRVRVAPQWSLGLSADFRHCSNGHITRPNLGTNTLSASLSASYDLEPQPTDYRQASASAKQPSASDSRAKASNTPADAENPPTNAEFTVPSASPEGPTAPLAPSASPAFRPRFYVDLSAGVSLKSLLEAFMADPSTKVKTYGVFTAVAAPMVRYHRMHASGLQFDFMYANYVDEIRTLDIAKGHEGEYRYSPFIMGLALRHEFFYRHFSIFAAAGIYLRHRTGHYSATEESRLYQAIGLRYSFPFTDDRLFVGYNVKAHHLSKADCMQFMVGWRL